MVKASRKLDQW